MRQNDKRRRVKWWGETYEALDSVNAACEQDSGHESRGLHDCSELLFLLVGKEEGEERMEREEEQKKSQEGVGRASIDIQSDPRQAPSKSSRPARGTMAGGGCLAVYLLDLVL